MSRYRLAQLSRVPYATLSDLCSGKTEAGKCSAETIYRVAKALGVTMEELVAPCIERRSSFELFKSAVCHRLKEQGDIEFLIDTLERDEIREYYEKSWFPECFYLLAMVDYLSRMNNIPLCGRYAPIRKLKLKDTLYPSGVLSRAGLRRSEKVREEALARAIPEFLHFNIVENEIRNVI